MRVVEYTSSTQVTHHLGTVQAFIEIETWELGLW